MPRRLQHGPTCPTNHFSELQNRSLHIAAARKMVLMTVTGQSNLYLRPKLQVREGKGPVRGALIHGRQFLCTKGLPQRLHFMLSCLHTVLCMTVRTIA